MGALRRLSRALLVVGALLSAAVLPARAQKWIALGPDGGDVRSLAVDPRDAGRVYLGAADGHVFASEDGGEHWALRGRIGSRRDAVVQRLLVDSSAPDRLLAAVWYQDPSAGGGVFLSVDGARTWSLAGLAGEAARALEQSPSDPRLWLAGTRTGVFRSLDGGATWTKISPAGHAELRNFDSLAIDPRNPDVIYAGTYHLPWKTLDGGKTWFPVHRGMIDDSDVMSIVVDPSATHRVYASACSGIYRSDSAGAQWMKIQGIPYSARRTHAIRIDPARAGALYAATTEGLWKTADGGATWRRMTPREWVVNDAQILPTGRLLLATESQGILRSDNGGDSFSASNAGFPHRAALDLAVDPLRTERILVRLGPSPATLTRSDDGGGSWKPLGGNRVPPHIRRLYGTPWGWWAALERGGIARWDEKRATWIRFGWTARSAPAAAATAATKRPIIRAQLSAVVNGAAFSGNRVFLATDRGLFAGDPRGLFALLPAGRGATAFQAVCARDAGKEIWVSSGTGILRSTDAGRTWSRVVTPGSGAEVSWLDLVRHADGHRALAGTRKGVYLTQDGGSSWTHLGSGLPATPAQAVAVDAGRVAAAMSSGGLFLSDNGGLTWERVAASDPAGLFTSLAFLGPGTLLAASKEDGLFRIELDGLSAGVPAAAPSDGSRR